VTAGKAGKVLKSFKYIAAFRPLRCSGANARIGWFRLASRNESGRRDPGTAPAVIGN
jgi:hypothetical protein